MAIGFLAYEGRLPGYDSLMCVRKTFGRRGECYAMQLIWTDLIALAVMWASSLAITLQIAYASWRGWSWSELEQELTFV